MVQDEHMVEGLETVFVVLWIEEPKWAAAPDVVCNKRVNPGKNSNGRILTEVEDRLKELSNHPSLPLRLLR